MVLLFAMVNAMNLLGQLVPRRSETVISRRGSGPGGNTATRDFHLSMFGPTPDDARIAGIYEHHQARRDGKHSAHGRDCP